MRSGQPFATRIAARRGHARHMRNERDRMWRSTNHRARNAQLPGKRGDNCAGSAATPAQRTRQPQTVVVGVAVAVVDVTVAAATAVTNIVVVVVAAVVAIAVASVIDDVAVHVVVVVVAVIVAVVALSW